MSGLVNNAGIAGSETNSKLQTADHFEAIFGINHLGHFLLTHLLLPFLTPDARITNVSSEMHNPKQVIGQDITYPGAENLAYPNKIEVIPVLKYCLSKLCNIYFTYELVRRLEKSKSSVHVNAFNPGLMLDTEFARTSDQKFKEKLPEGFEKFVVPAATSGKNLAELTIGEKWAKSNGIYNSTGTEVESSELSHNLKNALDLWEASQKFVNLPTTI